MSPRQTQVLDLIRRGFTNKEIASVLGLSLGTIKTHVQLILKRLNARNRTEAAVSERKLVRGRSFKQRML